MEWDSFLGRNCLLVDAKKDIWSGKNIFKIQYNLATLRHNAFEDRQETESLKLAGTYCKPPVGPLCSVPELF